MKKLLVSFFLSIAFFVSTVTSAGATTSINGSSRVFNENRISGRCLTVQSLVYVTDQGFFTFKPLLHAESINTSYQCYNNNTTDDLALAYTIYYWTGTWSPCISKPWTYSNYRNIYELSYLWAGYKGPCGAGYYGMETWGARLVNGVWHGYETGVWAGYVSMPGNSGA